jgi:hypothetical protein
MRLKSVIAVSLDFFGVIVVVVLTELGNDSLVRSLNDFRSILFRTMYGLSTMSSDALHLTISEGHTSLNKGVTLSMG